MSVIGNYSAAAREGLLPNAMAYMFLSPHNYMMTHLEKDNHWTVGQLVSIQVGYDHIIGIIVENVVSNGHWMNGENNDIEIKVELLGQLFADKNGEANPFFQRNCDLSKVGVRGTPGSFCRI